MANPEETPEPPLSDRVDSWKEIAQYLDRDLRTVQRWEKERGLPVHRSPGGKRGVIYAMKPELDDWWKQASILDQDDAATGLAAGREEDLAKRIRRWKRLTFVLAALAAMSTILAGVVMWFRRPLPDLPSRTFTFTPGMNVQTPAISPDGRHIAYVAGEDLTLWIQDLDEVRPRKMEAKGAMNPFWSPDSKSVGYFTWVGTTTPVWMKTRVQGGSPEIAGNLPPERSVRVRATWSQNGDYIVASAGFSRLYAVPAGGGPARYLQKSGGSNLNQINRIETWSIVEYDPHFLTLGAGRQAIAFATSTALASDMVPATPEMVVQDLETNRRETLVAGTEPVYSPTGHLLYRPPNSQDLWALPFSIKSLKSTGKPFLIASNADSASVAKDGTVVYLEIGTYLDQLFWFDRSGRKLAPVGQPQATIGYPTLSPDGRFVALSAEDPGSANIWIHDIARPVKTRLTFNTGRDALPIWSPNGSELLYSRQFVDGARMYSVPVNGSKEARLLLDPAKTQYAYPFDWSADGKYIVYRSKTVASGTDIWYLKRKDGGADYESIPFLQTPFDEDTPKLSPNGRFLAYSSNESGRDEIYIRLFPSGEGKVPVSSNRGTQPRWRRDGRELFYVQGDALIAVPVMTEPALSLGSPKLLFRHPGLAWTWRSQKYDASADGSQFLVGVHLESEKPSVIRVVQNWYDRFRDRQSRPR